MFPLTPFPNPKLVLKEILEDGLDVEAGTASPATPWVGDPPFLRIRVFGGSSTLIQDSPRFDIDALTNDEQASDDLAELVRQLLIGGPHTTSHGVLDQVACITRPNLVPWGVSQTVFNVTATYSAALRRA